MANYRAMKKSDLTFIRDLTARKILETALQDSTKVVEVGESSFDDDGPDFYCYCIDSVEIHRFNGF